MSGPAGSGVLPADVAPPGGKLEVRAVEARPPSRARTSCAASAAHSLIATNLVTRVHGGAGDQQYCHEGVTLPAPAPRIGQCLQPLIALNAAYRAAHRRPATGAVGFVKLRGALRLYSC